MSYLSVGLTNNEQATLEARKVFDEYNARREASIPKWSKYVLPISIVFWAIAVPLITGKKNAWYPIIPIGK